jgi:preprotein translocase subunit Sss1
MHRKRRHSKHVKKPTKEDLNNKILILTLVNIILGIFNTILSIIHGLFNKH